MGNWVTLVTSVTALESVPSGGRGLERVGLEAAPGWIWLVGNPMGKGSGSYSHKPVEPVDSVDQFCQPTPLYLLLFFPWK